MRRLDRLFFEWYGLVVSNPLKIATQANGGRTTVFEPGEMKGGAASGNLAFLMDLGSLYRGLKDQALLLTSIVILVTLISMMFVKKSEKLADKKADIEHKLLIVFLIGSLLWLLELILAVVDFVF